MPDSLASSAVLTASTVSQVFQPEQIVNLSYLATGGLILMWGIFWLAMARNKESVHGILSSPGFFRTVTVMGVVAATVVLSLAGRVDGNMTGAILSGIVGYVLGQLSASTSKSHKQTDDEQL